MKLGDSGRSRLSQLQWIPQRLPMPKGYGRYPLDVPSTPGVYKLCVVDASYAPIPIPRESGKTDEQGIIRIGRSNNLQQRCRKHHRDYSHASMYGDQIDFWNDVNGVHGQANLLFLYAVCESIDETHIIESLLELDFKDARQGYGEHQESPLHQPEHVWRRQLRSRIISS